MRGAHPRGMVAPLEEVCFHRSGSAICVQSLDDSLNSAIRTTYRISLRSSSLREPRYPLLRVVFGLYHRLGKATLPERKATSPLACLQSSVFGVGLKKSRSAPSPVKRNRDTPTITVRGCVGRFHRNDPSAGSPTETLLRLLLPLNDKVRETFPRKAGNRRSKSPNSSPDHSIGRSDGRCVQRAGT